MDLKKIMEDMKKNRVRVFIEGEAKRAIGASRFGGTPDVPAGFQWPYYYGASVLDDLAANRPLSFLAQFNCEELAKYDVDGLLPKRGLLSFFYEEETSEWGYDPKHKGCARVFYFEHINELKKAEFPEDLGEDYRNPEMGISFETQVSYPDSQDIQIDLEEEQYDEYEEYLDDDNCVHQFLGWPGLIQNNIAMECELVSRGYYLGSGWQDIPEEEKAAAWENAGEKWQLLLQLDEVEGEDFYLSFGDCGRLYFYITKEDLQARKFENVWLVYQCF